MDEWSEWQELGVLSLSCEVSFAFQYDWASMKLNTG